MFCTNSVLSNYTYVNNKTYYYATGCPPVTYLNTSLSNSTKKYCDNCDPSCTSCEGRLNSQCFTCTIGYYFTANGITSSPNLGTCQTTCPNSKYPLKDTVYNMCRVLINNIFRVNVFLVLCTIHQQIPAIFHVLTEITFIIRDV